MSLDERHLNHLLRSKNRGKGGNMLLNLKMDPIVVTRDLNTFIADKELHKKLKLSLVVNDPNLDTDRVKGMIELISGNLTFIDTLKHFIDSRDMVDTAFYTGAGISRQVWFNISSSKKPSHETVYKAILGLKLSYIEASILMNKAGYDFDWLNKRALVVIFCIIHRQFDHHQVDQYLLEAGETAFFSQA
jgi:hypothetical protein